MLLVFIVFIRRSDYLIYELLRLGKVIVSELLRQPEILLGRSLAHRRSAPRKDIIHEAFRKVKPFALLLQLFCGGGCVLLLRGLFSVSCGFFGFVRELFTLAAYVLGHICLDKAFSRQIVKHDR